MPTRQELTGREREMFFILTGSKENEASVVLPSSAPAPKRQHKKKVTE